MRAVRIAPQRMRTLTLAWTAPSAALLAWHSHAFLREELLRFWPWGLPSPALFFGPQLVPLVALAAFALWLGLLLALTRIERFGVEFFGARRGWRITPDVSLVITAHASPFWLLSAILAVSLGRALESLVMWGPLDHLPRLVNWLSSATAFAGATGFLIGMIWFEWTTFLGVRACRYANPPEAEGESPGLEPLAPMQTSAS